MTRGQFIVCARTLREYSEWERNLYRCGLDLADTPVAHMAENLQATMCDFNPDWDYDTKLGISWIVEWSYGESDCYCQTRHGVTFNISDAAALYDFLVFMNEHGWED